MKNETILILLLLILPFTLADTGHNHTTPSAETTIDHTAMNHMAMNYSTLDHTTDHSTHTVSEHTAVLQQSQHQQTSPFNSINIITIILILLAIGGLTFFIRSLQGKDLLEYSFIKRLAKSKLYPKIIQIPTLIFFGFIIYYFFFGALSYAKNPGSILAWTLWWPLVPLTFILFGRIWCLACPLPIIGDVAQKFAHPTRKPGKFLIKYGIWITDGIFIAITLFDRLYGMVDTPWLSGSIFLLILAGAIIISIRYERRTFCKHLCFLGGVAGNYSMLSGLTIESKDKSICTTCHIKACYFGSGKADPCPYFNVIPTKQSMRNCTLCANCIKNCPNDNIAVRIRSIASELWSHAKVSFSESFFAKLMVGIVIIQNLGMLAIWSGLQGTLMNYGLGEKTAITTLYFIAIAIPLVFMTISSYFSNKLQTTPHSTSANFAAFGYAFIPIDVAGHIAHNIFHLLAEGKSVLGAFLGLFTGNVNLEGTIASSSLISSLQYTLIILGSAGTLYVAYKIARAKEQSTIAALKILLPHAILLTIIIFINFYLFALPMAHRGH